MIAVGRVDPRAGRYRGALIADDVGAKAWRRSGLDRRTGIRLDRNAAAGDL